MILALITISLLTGKIENPQNTFPNHIGTTGVLRSISAAPNKPTTFGAGFIANFFSQDPFTNNIKNSRNQFRVNGNYTFDWGLPIEVFGGATFTYNDNSTAASAKTMTTFFENTDLGLKVGHSIFSDSFFIAAFGHLRLFSGTRAPRNTSGGTTEDSGPLASGSIGLATTLDLSKRVESFPLRSHLHMAFRLPNGDLNSSADDFNRFALDSYKYPALIGTIGFELTYPYVTPFAEYSLEYAIADSGDAVQTKDNRQKLTGGMRINPFPAFGILAAVDYGIKGPATGAAIGIPRNPQVDFFVGLTFQAVGESLLGEYGSARGVVTDEKTGQRLSGVKITVIDGTVPHVFTDEAGAYEIPRLHNGSYQLEVSKEGYETATKPISIRDGGDALADLTLKVPGPKVGILEITVVDAANQSPLAGAVVKVSEAPANISTDENGRAHFSSLIEGTKDMTVEASGYDSQKSTITITPHILNSQTVALQKSAPTIGVCAGSVKNSDGTPLTAVFKSEDNSISTFGSDPITGEFQQTMPIGSHHFRVQAENYLPQVITCDVTGDGATSTPFTVTLEKPKQAVVIDDKIVLPDAIYFDFGKDKIKKESFSILNQVAGLLLKEKDYKTLKIEGHTDDIGSDKANQKLSEARAKSVKKYLTLKGVSAKKIEAIGFGESTPVSTNLTPEGRSENRRVEFNLIRE